MHVLPRAFFERDSYPNQFVFDETSFVARVLESDHNSASLLHFSRSGLMDTEAWGLKPLDLYQAMALNLLLDPQIHLVNLTGSAGSGKTILALAAAIE